MIQDILQQFMAVVMKSTIFSDVVLCCLVEVYRHFGGMYFSLLVPCFAYSSVLRIEIVCSLETSVNVYQPNSITFWEMVPFKKFKITAVFTHATLCSLVDKHQCFGGPAASQGTRQTQGVTLDSHLEGSEFDLLSDLYRDFPRQLTN
jgi:hypothetical protein